MRWTERQRAMLREMGIALWAPDDEPRAVEVATAAPSAEAAPAGLAPTRPRAPPAAADASRADRRDPAAGADAVPRLPGLAAADWLVVAEPLDRADPQQEQLLDNMLRAIGVGLVAPTRERRAVFAPLGAAGPAAAASPAAAVGPGGASSEQAALAAAIATVAPRCILAFGRAAAAALLGADAPIGGLRGRVHAHAGVPVVVTFSVPFLLRHPAEKAKAWADLCLAVATVASATS